MEKGALGPCLFVFWHRGERESWRHDQQEVERGESGLGEQELPRGGGHLGEVG